MPSRLRRLLVGLCTVAALMTAPFAEAWTDCRYIVTVHSNDMVDCSYACYFYSNLDGHDQGYILRENQC